MGMHFLCKVPEKGALCTAAVSNDRFLFTVATKLNVLSKAYFVILVIERFVFGFPELVS
jgi:hypothetical protein